jgi:hypothetical protein
VNDVKRVNFHEIELRYLGPAELAVKADVKN